MFTVMTWNVENLFQPEPSDQTDFDAKLAALVDVITTAQLAVLAFQEIGDEDAFEALRASADWTGVLSTHFEARHPIRVGRTGPDGRRSAPSTALVKERTFPVFATAECAKGHSVEVHRHLEAEQRAGNILGRVWSRALKAAHDRDPKPLCCDPDHSGRVRCRPPGQREAEPSHASWPLAGNGRKRDTIPTQLHRQKCSM